MSARGASTKPAKQGGARRREAASLRRRTFGGRQGEPGSASREHGADRGGDRRVRVATGACPPARTASTRRRSRRDQRERLQTALIELIAQRGYQAVRILDLTKLARVSRPTFYSLYADKEELFLAAYDEIAKRTASTIMAGLRDAGLTGRAPAQRRCAPSPSWLRPSRRLCR